MTNFSETVIPIIRRTRELLLPYWGNIESTKQKDESASSVVTRLDEEIEQYLFKELKVLYPDIDFVGEEFGGNRTAKKFWLVDPIDGTAHFIRGTAFCTTMLALIDDGQVVFSVIYDFVNDIVYHAEKGKGAYKNGKPIHVSDRPITNSYVCWETHLDKPENMKKFMRLIKFMVTFKTIASGYEHALIAEGKLEGRICFDPYGGDYDYAPGALLVAEAGGIVANLGKTNYDFRNLNYMAVNPPLYKKLTEGDDPIFPIGK